MWKTRSRHISEEQKHKLSKALKGKLISKFNPFYGKHHTEESKNKMRSSDFRTLEYILKLSIGAKKGHITRLPHSIQTREKIRQADLKFWANKEWAIERSKKLRLAQHIMPNNQEKSLQNLLELLFPNTWTFIGDGKIPIGGKHPDFYDNKNAIIELFGDYWHRGENPQNRIDFFKNINYNCIVIWEHELRHKKELTQKLLTWYPKQCSHKIELSGTWEQEP
mgnify:FL=1